VHTEVVNGSVAFVAYYLSPTEVVSIADLDRADMQANRRALRRRFIATAWSSSSSSERLFTDTT